MVNQASWLIRQAGKDRRLRLFCFSYAGGNASAFAQWQSQLGPAVEVCAIQLPGRGARMAEQPFLLLRPLIEQLAQIVSAERNLSFAFFGHSLGGLIAFELTRYLRAHHLPLPEHLFVSGCSAPSRRNPPKNLHKLADDALIAELVEYNGTPAELLAHRELMALVLPTIRADFAIAEEYVYRTQPRFKVPITALAGRDDDHTSIEQMQAWQDETSGGFHLEWFSGDHFFINAQRQLVLDFLNNQINDLQLIRPA